MTDLADYPNLVRAPADQGGGIRCRSNGRPVSSVAACAAERPIEYAAAIYGITTAEALDCLRYARAHRMI